jgi:hypothetical protein
VFWCDLTATGRAHEIKIAEITLFIIFHAVVCKKNINCGFYRFAVCREQFHK